MMEPKPPAAPGPIDLSQVAAQFAASHQKCWDYIMKVGSHLWAYDFKAILEWGAEQIGKSVEDLTDIERQQIILTATLEQGE